MAAGVIAAAPYITSKAMAAQPVSSTKNAGFYRTKVGDIEVISLLDGGMTLSDSLMVNTNAGEIRQSKKDNVIRTDSDFPAFVNAFVINTGKKITMVDTGAKGMAESLGHVSDNLLAAGLSGDMIDEIIITHAHPDHTNGLVDANGGMMFPNAKIKISAAELAFWFSDENMNAMVDKKQMFELARKNLGPYQSRKNIETFQSNTDFGGGISAVDLAGHTPGHSGVRISNGKEQILIWGDIVHVPALQFAHPKAGIAFDVDVQKAQKTRLKIFDEVEADKIRVAGMHLSFPGLGHLVKRGAGYDFVPQIWEM